MKVEPLPRSLETVMRPPMAVIRRLATPQADAEAAALVLGHHLFESPNPSSRICGFFGGPLIVYQ